MYTSRKYLQVLSVSNTTEGSGKKISECYLTLQDLINLCDRTQKKQV